MAGIVPDRLAPSIGAGVPIPPWATPVCSFSAAGGDKAPAAGASSHLFACRHACMGTPFAKQTPHTWANEHLADSHPWSLLKR